MGSVIGEVCNNEDADTFAAQWEDFVNDAGLIILGLVWVRILQQKVHHRAWKTLLGS